jgi:hypothetical protein
MSDQDKQEILQAIEGLKQENAAQMEGLRQQNSAQHDEQLSFLKTLNSMVIWLKAKWERFGRGSTTWPGDPK